MSKLWYDDLITPGGDDYEFEESPHQLQLSHYECRTLLSRCLPYNLWTWSWIAGDIRMRLRIEGMGL